jgi:hypothetical protein
MNSTHNITYLQSEEVNDYYDYEYGYYKTLVLVVPIVMFATFTCIVALKFCRTKK